MLTFSREQQSVEAAVAVFFHPPSLLSTSHVPSLFSFSCFPPRRMTGMKCWLLIKTTRPASVPVILLTCSLSLSLFLILSFSHYFSPLCFFCHSPRFVPAPPCRSGSVSHSVLHTSPLFSFSSFHPSSSLPCSCCLSTLRHPSSHLPTHPLTSTPTSEQRIGSRESGGVGGGGIKREEDRDVAVSGLRQACHQLGDLKARVSGSAPRQFTSSSHNQRKALTCTCRRRNHPTRGPPHGPRSLGFRVMEHAY